MGMRQPYYSIEEHARRGNDLYERRVRPHVEASNQGKVVAIDVDTGSSRWLTRPPTGHQGDYCYGLHRFCDAASCACHSFGADTDPLVGMSLLDHHALRIDILNGGVVTITALP